MGNFNIAGENRNQLNVVAPLPEKKIILKKIAKKDFLEHTNIQKSLVLKAENAQLLLKGANDLYLPSQLIGGTPKLHSVSTFLNKVPTETLI